jgi:NAD(P)-dependent dehydrogenase (short-subunit alcohol dehydrogenase family)
MSSAPATAFDLTGKVVAITGGAGLLGIQHAEAVAAIGGTPVLLDLDADRLRQAEEIMAANCGRPILGITCDITAEDSVQQALCQVLTDLGGVHCLVNNAANNMKMEEGDPVPPTRLEVFPIDTWRQDFEVCVTGALICSRVFGSWMADNGGGGIVNISSDLGIIAPDQRVYEVEGLIEEDQVVKPVSYSVIKHAIIGLTKYLATYWAHKDVRVNALCPGGVFSGQPEELVSRLAFRIPLGRMAREDEYRGAIQFLCSEASSYMTGACLVIDGGRSVW